MTEKKDIFVEEKESELSHATVKASDSSQEKTENEQPVLVKPARTLSVLALFCALVAGGAGYVYYEHQQSQLAIQKMLQQLTSQIDQQKVDIAQQYKIVEGLSAQPSSVPEVKIERLNDQINMHLQDWQLALSRALEEIHQQTAKVEQAHHQSNHQFREKLDQLQNELAQHTAILEQYRGLVSTAQETAVKSLNSVSALKNEVNAETLAQQAERQDIEQLKQKLFAATDDQVLNLAEVHYLLRLADHQLRFQQHIELTTFALKRALERLGQVDEPRFAETMHRIQEVFGALNELQLPNREQIVKNISTISQQIMQAPLLSDRQVGLLKNNFLASSQQQTDEQRSIWERLTTNLVPLVRIDHERVPTPALMATEDVFFLNQNVQLQLAAARNAVLMNMPQTYQASLLQAREWIAQYYDPADENVAAALALIDEMRRAQYSETLPDLTPIIRAFEAAMNLRQGVKP